MNCCEILTAFRRLLQKETAAKMKNHHHNNFCIHIHCFYPGRTACKQLTLPQFLQIVKHITPWQSRRKFLVDKAAANLTTQKALLILVLTAGGNDKTFDGTVYYRNNQTQLNIPTGMVLRYRPALNI